ncbi:allophanate hydrolase [Paenibacillus sp. YYML68]|uniref:allophanate hydrolase n=1 Tax=Paenibacillus sp. YYML68 TaxID=2909250 RepID=UPI0024924BAA|nr:allophanate hydrolase [Paenibacillus sp. YYML68]
MTMERNAASGEAVLANASSCIASGDGEAAVGALLTIDRLREQYSRKEVTPQAVIEAIIERAAEEADYHIWITPPDLSFIQPYLDRLAELDPNDAPLWGVPFAIKDNIDLAGVPTTAACPDYAYTPDRHAAVVERLIAAGAIPVGKTNLDQFATGLVGTRSPYGETRNALKPELISGGSSSGSAAAVARGHAAFALGTDTAGSGRVPAALHGLVGYKPSLGAWSTRGVVPACASLDCVTVFAHSLADALAVDAAARGVEAADPWSRAIASPAAGKRLPQRVCLPREPLAFYGPYAEGYRAAWEAAVRRLELLHVELSYIDMSCFTKAAALLYEGPWVAERWAGLGAFVEANPDSVFPVTERILRTGAASEWTAASLFQAMHQLQAYKQEARLLLADAVLMLPTCGGTWSREAVRQDPVGTNRAMGQYTNHCNLLDLCAVAIPTGEAAEAVPFGVTLFALSEHEGLICAAAERIVELDMADAADRAMPQATPDAADRAMPQGTPDAADRAMPQGTPDAADRAMPQGTPDAADRAMPQGTADAAADRCSDVPTTLVAVCGLHMRGFPLEQQMLGCGARFVSEALTAATYKLVKLSTVPAKPGLVKLAAGGAAIQLELWAMPLTSFGGFAAGIPAPLGIGKVELADGREVSGFVCEAYAAESAEDISAFGGWRSAMKEAAAMPGQ